MMPIPAGFPDINEATATLNDATYQNRHDLRYIANDIVGFLGQIEDANKADYRSIANQINAKISAVRRLNGKDCESLADLVAETEALPEGFRPIGDTLPGGGPEPSPIVPVPIRPVTTGDGGETGGGECGGTPPVCGDPGSVFWCLHFFSGRSEYWQVFCEPPDIIPLVALRLDATIFGAWLTYDEALQCCCSHGTNCPSYSA